MYVLTVRDWSERVILGPMTLLGEDQGAEPVRVMCPVEGCVGASRRPDLTVRALPYRGRV